MKAANPYLNFDGNTEDAFRFYQSVFGGELTVTRFRDLGGNPMGIPEADLDKIANIALPLGPHNVLMATDTLESFPRPLKPGNNFYIEIEPDSAEEADRLFDALSDGGDIEMPLQETVWAEKYGSFTDRYGIQWMVNYEGSVKFAGSQTG